MSIRIAIPPRSRGAPGRPWRRLRLGLGTLLGAKPGGFFIPYRHAAVVAPVAYPALEPLLVASLPVMLGVLARIEASAERLLTLAGPPPAPRWDQDWFPRLDAAALYTLVQAVRPRRILEVGSGHSTRFVARAVADAGLDCAITCIDPEPRADLGRLPVRLERRVLAPADAALAETLEAGDMLLVDSSHIAMPGSDVDLLLNGFLPRLRPGVLVHLHDIMLPDPYPEAWVWRGYNEQVAVACLLHGGGWAIRFASHYLVTRHAARLAQGVIARLPLPEGAIEGSLWLERLPGGPTEP
ncbi:class I SAM-dependent methyltransferase [Benzoatithermus flavus]|uniref:Class I SAM-dependent methyltransferase n=1 Tax=Benzoatithermus flavus TaxID=3108223 RepID=A0ABU8XPV1_9PROT